MTSLCHLCGEPIAGKPGEHWTGRVFHAACLDQYEKNVAQQDG